MTRQQRSTCLCTQEPLFWSQLNFFFSAASTVTSSGAALGAACAAGWGLLAAAGCSGISRRWTTCCSLPASAQITCCLGGLAALLKSGHLAAGLSERGQPAP